METNKAAYWIVVGVLALGLNSEYRQGNFVALHRVAARADSELCRITARAERTLAVAIKATGMASDQTASRLDNVLAESDLLREQARDQAEFVRDEIRAQADVIRAQAEMRRAEMAQVRWHTRSRFELSSVGNRGLTVLCPKTGARIVMNRVILSNAAPEIEVDDSF
jgi:hypothetical protein